jgi:hypothetical protein
VSDSALKRWLRIGVIVSAGLVLVVVLGVGATAATTPDCAGCHSGRGSLVADTESGPHGAISCESCHVPADAAGRVVFASRQLFGMTLRVAPGADRSAADVPDGVCLECHKDVLEGVVASRGYLIDHVYCAEGSQCTDCHSSTAHGDSTAWVRSSEMSDCLECHTPLEASEDCGTCHDPRTESERLTAGAWSVTHGSNWRDTHGMGNMATCSACHDESYCTDCHGVSLPHPDRYVTSDHSDEALGDRQACETCHESAFCSDCHGLEMPHPSLFITEHAVQSEELGRAACERCHSESDCTICHVKHVHPGNAAEAARDPGTVQ